MSHDGNRFQASLFPMSAVQGRHPDDLDVGIPDHFDGAHPSRARHAYEWWYFDARFADGHTFAGTISNLAPQIYLQINTPDGRTLDVRVTHDDERASTERCDVATGESWCRGSHPRYDLHFAGDGVEVDLTFESLVKGWARGDGSVVFGGYGNPEVFGWLVPQPRARVHGTLRYDGRTHAVEGEGYHDHNWGDFKLQKYINRWHWGRITRPDLTVVFADVITNHRCGRVHLPTMFLARGDRIVFETFEMQWSFGDYRLDDTGLQLYPRDISFTFAERDVTGRLTFRPKDVFALDDLLADAKVPGWLGRVVGEIAAQPVYFRLDAAYEGEITVGDERLTVEGETLIEYMAFELRRGQVPHDERSSHFLHPPRLDGLHRS